MKFSSVLAAVFGLSAFAAALPAPVASDSGFALAERAAVPAIAERTVAVNLVADVQVCINAVVAINKKYSAKKTTMASVQAWSAEVVVQIKALIAVISAYPAGCTYPSIDICVNIFVQLFVAIFVQLKVFLGLLGLVASLLLTVDVLLQILLGVVGDLLNILVQLCLLIEVKIKVGITAQICVALKGLVDLLYLQAFVELLVKAGLSISL